MTAEVTVFRDDDETVCAGELPDGLVKPFGESNRTNMDNFGIEVEKATDEQM